MAEAGRPSELTDASLVIIRKGILEGKDLKVIAAELGIAEDTIYKWNWENYKDFKNKVDGWRRDRMLIKAEKNIEEFIHMKPETKDDKKIVADLSKFVSETLGNKAYSKAAKVENTGNLDIKYSWKSEKSPTPPELNNSTSTTTENAGM